MLVFFNFNIQLMIYLKNFYLLQFYSKIIFLKIPGNIKLYLNLKKRKYQQQTIKICLAHIQYENKRKYSSIHNFTSYQLQMVSVIYICHCKHIAILWYVTGNFISSNLTNTHLIIYVNSPKVFIQAQKVYENERIFIITLRGIRLKILYLISKICTCF